ncbi:MAG: hypothetical protein JST16_12025 [Bdellovibrionales bacterium]|nr:hypothetical protein [Bdellovibrionales bacterium]
MAGAGEPDGKNSLLGEFLVALVRAPEHVQEAVILNGLQQLMPYANTLIAPYPMLSHLLTIVTRDGDKPGKDGK